MQKLARSLVAVVALGTLFLAVPVETVSQAVPIPIAATEAVLLSGVVAQYCPPLCSCKDGCGCACASPCGMGDCKNCNTQNGCVNGCCLISYGGAALCNQKCAVMN